MSNRVIDIFGGTQWINSDGQWHRTDGPAYTSQDGSQFWCINGHYHRTDGPAIIYADGTQKWYMNGHQITDEADIKLFTGKEEDLIYLRIKYDFN